MAEQTPDWLTPSVAVPLDGMERFTGLDATVADFWRWAFSDLRDNTTRGILAEFLVAKAVGDERDLRIGWDNYDARAPDGTTIEVKCSAYLQSWTLKRHSELRFGRLIAREFDAARNEYSAEARVRAEVFVFCVQTQRDPVAYDMFDLSHWEFWVTDANTIRERAVKTIGIGWVRQHATGPFPYADLAGAIRAAARPRANPAPASAAAASDTNQRLRPSLDERLQRAGPEVIAVAQRLRTLGDEVGVQVVQGPASLQLRDRLGAIVLLYPTYRSVEFALEFAHRSGHETEIGELRAALQQIAGNARHLPGKYPSLHCRKVLDNWEAVAGILRDLVQIRAQAGQ